MPRRAQFTREEIIQASFRLVDSEGLSRLTARGVANRLKASTAPVYSNFKNMDELTRTVILHCRDRLQDFATTAYTEHVFLNMGIGIIKFAREHQHLFRALFLETADYKDILVELRESLLTEMDRDEALEMLSHHQKDELLFKMSIITYGIAAQVCVGLMVLEDDDEIIEILSVVGSTVVGAALDNAASQKSYLAKDK